MRGVDLNHRPPGYEPDILPTELPRNTCGPTSIIVRRTKQPKLSRTYFLGACGPGVGFTRASCSTSSFPQTLM